MMRRVFGFLLLCLCICGTANAQFMPSIGSNDQPAEQVEVPPPSPNDVRELMRLLSDESMQEWLRKSAERTADGRGGSGDMSPRDLAEAGVERLSNRIEEVGRSLRRLPNLPGVLGEELENGLSPAEKVRVLTLLVIFIIVGGGLEWLYRQTVRNVMLRLEHAPQSGPVGRVLTSLRRAALMFAGLAIFAIGSAGTFGAFDWPPFIRATIIDVLALLLIFRAFQMLTFFFLAPYAPPLRLVPWSTSMARQVTRMLMVAAAVTIAAFAVLSAVQRLIEFGQADRDLTLELIAAELVVAVILLLLTWGMIAFVGWRAPQWLGGFDAARRRRWVVGQILMAVLALLALLAWVVGATVVMWALLIFGPLLLILAGVKAWIDHFFDQSTDALLMQHRKDYANALEEFRAGVEQIDDPEERAAMVEPEMPEMPDPYVVSRPIVQRAVRFVLVIGAIFLFAIAWGVDWGDAGAGNSLIARVLRVLFDSIVVLLLADLLWTWARTVIDKRLSDYRPPEGSEAPGPDARMITLLPLFRVTILVILLSMVGLSILNSLGINIAPLLAGAGILGIAIGFGTQSLVRDIVSGLFFLIDDAFRVGEYIEVGDLMGSVESISIRSMRIRHHRGKVHTVPYGELKSVTNHSRDWVIMKLEFRVPFDTDLQLVKKLVKKVGAELKENDFYGPSILSTLKSQGVRRMEEFNMVVGVKFMTKPGEQWLVRRDAYQKVRDAFEANGIRLAERNVKVEIDRDPSSLTEEERNAIAAAAQQASEAPAGPPKPIPDEP